jgi:hypothetical protein
MRSELRSVTHLQQYPLHPRREIHPGIGVLNKISGLPGAVGIRAAAGGHPPVLTDQSTTLRGNP